VFGYFDRTRRGLVSACDFGLQMGAAGKDGKGEGPPDSQALQIFDNFLKTLLENFKVV
jgi:hypothetical protein